MKTFFFGFMLSNDILYLFCGLIYHTCDSRVKHMVIFSSWGGCLSAVIICFNTPYLLEVLVTLWWLLSMLKHQTCSSGMYCFWVKTEKLSQSSSLGIFGKVRKEIKCAWSLIQMLTFFSNPIKYTRVSFDRNVSFWPDGAYSSNTTGWFLHL